MMPGTIKLVFAVISHTTFDTFSSLTLGGSSGASGDDNLDKISRYKQYMILSRIKHDNGKVTHVRTRVPVIYWSIKAERELLVPGIETPGTSLR